MAVLVGAIGIFFCMEAFGTGGNEITGNAVESGQRITGEGENALKTEFFGKLPKEREKTEQKVLYAFYAEELEQMLSENRMQEQKGTRYMESVGSVYLYQESYSGALAAYYEDGGIMAFRMVMTENGPEKRQKYEYRLLQDGSFWFTYQTESGSKTDLPDYTVNDVLRYSRTDYVYDDGTTDLAETRQNREKELEQYMEEETDGEIQEFWSREERLYRVDRETEQFIEVTDEKENCIADFLSEQSGRIDCRLAVSEDSFAEIEKYKPAGYSLLWEKNGWNDIAACDLNHDGKMDYVAALYPDDYEDVRRYADDSPYENWPQYYAAGFWLLLSGDDGGYERIQLSDSIEYWENELSLVETVFVEEGILQLEYFVGRSPFSNAVLQFRYDTEMRDFYIVRSDYRDSYDDALLIGDVSNYGRTTMHAYFTGRQHYCEGLWESMEDIPLPNGNVLGYFSDSFQYRCMNPVEERDMNSLIQEREKEILTSLTENYPSGGLDIHMLPSPVYYNTKLVSGRVEIYYDEEDTFVRIQIPVMADKQSGAYVMITDLIEKEEFLLILEEWTKDALAENAILPEERMRYINAAEENWEGAELVENCLKKEDGILSLQIAGEGVRVGIRESADGWVHDDYFTIDKEYFIGTKVWEYYRQ